VRMVLMESCARSCSFGDWETPVALTVSLLTLVLRWLRLSPNVHSLAPRDYTSRRELANMGCTRLRARCPRPSPLRFRRRGGDSAQGAKPLRFRSVATPTRMPPPSCRPLGCFSCEGAGLLKQVHERPIATGNLGHGGLPCGLFGSPLHQRIPKRRAADGKADKTGNRCRCF
jgi:hypothetical protein